MYLFCMNVPMNQAGIEEYENYEEDMKNVKTFELSENEFNIANKKGGLFKKFNEAFGIIIDYSEEERIEREDLNEAILIAEKEKSHAESQDEITTMDKVIDSLRYAKECETFWEIEVFLK